MTVTIRTIEGKKIEFPDCTEEEALQLTTSEYGLEDNEIYAVEVEQ